jgi:drug/metabolite transporter (DMT)-like permease
LKPADLAQLVALGALWGASYLFMRLGGNEFGPVALAGLRAVVAALCLCPLLLAPALRRELATHWRPIAVVGVVGAALPFVLFGVATQGISTGLAATLNAVTPLFATTIAWAWFGERPGHTRLAGLLLGVVGVVGLVHDSIGLKAGHVQAAWAVAAALGATLAYGATPNLTRRYLTGVSPLVTTLGGQAVSALLLAGPTAWCWPDTPPSLQAWAALVVLGVGSTAVAYLVFFRLIARIGSTRAVTVSFLVPVFGMLWGALFLGEHISTGMAWGAAVVLLGTALATGLVGPRAGKRGTAAPAAFAARTAGR